VALAIRALVILYASLMPPIAEHCLPNQFQPELDLSRCRRSARDRPCCSRDTRGCKCDQTRRIEIRPVRQVDNLGPGRRPRLICPRGWTRVAQKFHCHKRLLCGSVKLQSMRRLLASFVLSLIGWGVLAPIALASVAAKTVECCRRNGKHHCMSDTSGMSGTSSQSGNSSGFSSHSDGCPYRFQASTPTSPAHTQPGVLSSLSQPAANRPAEVDFLFYSSRRGQDNSQRGPPSF
jgi:hypothetical protein